VPHHRGPSAGPCAVARSVDYRLAPENAYPTPGEDCYAALCWLAEHADELGLDASRISVGGESAGANLAAVLCLMARDRSGPVICHQWLDVPATDLTMSQPSIHSVPDGYLLDLDGILEFRAAYLADPAGWTEPYASPLHAADLTGLPRRGS
jgi:acetyl esterase